MNYLLSEKEWNYWYGRVYGYFFKRIRHREEVEDITVRTMHKYFLKEYNQKNQGLMWMIARHEYIDYLRAQRKSTIALEEVEIETEQTQYYNAKVQDLFNCLRKYVKGVNVEIIQLILLEDKHSHEISKELDMNPATIRKRLSRSLQKVRKNCVDVWLPDTCTEPHSTPTQN